jgi:phage shock protein PspC (stress-responsive transcriptional regulator)
MEGRKRRHDYDPQVVAIWFGVILFFVVFWGSVGYAIARF